MTDNSRADAVRSAAAVVVKAVEPDTADTETKQSQRSLAELHADKQATRLALAQTLDAIEDKINVPKKLKRAAANLKTTLRKTGREQPLALLAIAAGAAGLVGTAVWWVASRFTRD